MSEICKRVVFFIALLIAAITPAFANAGTPLLLLSVGHLYVGNAIIGLFEGLLALWVLRRWYDIDIDYLVWWMIGANYASTIIGFFVLAPFIDKVTPNLLGTHPVANLPGLIIIIWLFVFILSVAIEWFFLHVGVTREICGYSGLKKITFKVNLIVQCCSYVLLIPLFVSASGTTLLTSVHRERNLGFVKSKNAEVYYKPINGTGYRKITLDGSPALSEQISQEQLEKMASKYYFDQIPRLFGHRNESVDLRPSNQRKVKVRTGFWPIEGLRVENEENGEKYNIAMEMPFFFWWSKSPYILPGDQVVYQVGKYIVIFDTHTREIADVCQGTNPIVFLPGVKYEPDLLNER